MANEAPSFVAFFGDGTRTFRSRPELIDELERKTGRGISGLSKSLFSGDFRHAEMTETIRLALVGGGETPEVAASLTAAYAANRPIVEVLPLAVAILETAFFGKPAPETEGDEA
mgnify:CR=1 FL=1